MSASPVELVKDYGIDALRYFLAREVSTFEDSPFTIERFKSAYNSGLANGIGNMVISLMNLSEKYIKNREVKFMVKRQIKIRRIFLISLKRI